MDTDLTALLSSIEWLSPNLIALTVEMPDFEDHKELNTILHTVMQRYLYPGQENLTDDERTEVAWAVEDGWAHYGVVPHDSELFEKLTEYYDHDDNLMIAAIRTAQMDHEHNLYFIPRDNLITTVQETLFAE